MYALARKHAAKRPDAYAVRDSQQRLTWKNLVQWTDALAADLQQAGLRSGSRVSMWLPSRAEALVVLLACSRNGYVCNPSLHQNYTVDEVVQLLERIQSAALFAQPGYGADAARKDVFAAARALAPMKRVYRLDPPGTRAAATESAALSLPGNGIGPASLPAPDVNPDKIVYLAFTSGTTGQPKGVLHSDNTLLANGRAMVQDWGHDEHTIIYSHSPLSHHIATVAIEQSLIAGCELVVNDPPGGGRTARLDRRDRRNLRDGRADARDRHPRGHEAAGLEAARPGEHLLHGGLGHPAGNCAGVPRPRHQAAEHLRHDRERLASIHSAGRRRRGHHHHLRESAATVTKPDCGIPKIPTAKPRLARSARSARVARC